jgi:hypothetical protein
MADTANTSIESELRIGERLLWKGRPRGGLRLRAQDAFLIPFSLVWGGFAIFWEASVLTHIPRDTAVGWFFPLFGVPFVLFGLYFIVGRFWVDAMRRGRTEYALTDQRAIIASGLFTRTIRSIDYRSIPEIGLTEKSDKSGTISFGDQGPSAWWYRRNTFPGFEPTPSAFEMIDNVRSVYDLIRRAKAG